jgi:cobalt-zinc-cadmium resistance protein CzcA
LIKKSAGSVAGYIVFAQIILIVALIPIFSFQKVEGKMFSPLAFTLGYALLGSLILSITYVPVMCRVLLRKNVVERENFISRFFKKTMYMMFLWSEQRRKLTIFAFVALIAICGIRFMNYGTEFIPKLNEGALYVRATLPNSINLQESTRLAKEMKDKIRAFDEVKFVLNQVGRPNDGSDPTGFFNIEFHIQLHPEKEWERGLSKDEVVEEMRKELQTYPGIVFGFSQPIQDNVEEYVAGVKSSLVVKIFGNDLFKLEEYADQVAGAIRDVEGIEDLNVYRNIGLPELRIQLHDSKMARYGVDIANAQAVVEMAIGGSAVTTFYDEDRMFDVRIRFAKEYRDDDEKIGDILIPTESGVKIPLREIATISYITGPTFIYREGSSRYIAVGFSIEGRDLGSTIAEAKAKVARETNIPEENKVVWAGEFESKERATAQLAVIVPAVLLLILFLLYFNFRTIKDTFIAASTIPFAFIGGFVSLWLTGTVFGISAGIGFIILFGVNTINSIILIAVMKDNFRKMCLKEAISKGVYDRIRPVVMIALMGSLGLLPAALSSGMGSEIQKPLAIMIVGGLLICMILSLTVLPQVFYWAYRKENK